MVVSHYVVSKKPGTSASLANALSPEPFLVLTLALVKLRILSSSPLQLYHWVAKSKFYGALFN